MVSVTMATSEWIQFFKEAGIPPGPAVNYAVMFVDNRIQKNMLMDLNKEIMNELGITVVGDIIAILKHAKVVYRQEMCKAATELLHPGTPDTQSELRRSANSAASRMIANSLSRDSPPAAPLRQRPPTSKISVTVSNKLGAAKADENPAVPVKRRRVTAEMEGKYIITMPKGTTPRTKKILEQQAAKGPPRTSVFDRLGAEAKADAAVGGKPTGVFSRLGAAATGATASESDDDSSVLQYAGVLKKLGRPFRKDGVDPGGNQSASSEAKPAERYGIHPLPKPRRSNMDAATAAAAAPRGGDVTADKPHPEFRVTIKRIWGCGKLGGGGGGGGGDGGPAAQMDNAGSVSVFKRLGKKPD